MEAAEKEVRQVKSKVYARMRTFGVIELDEVTFDEYKPHMKELDENVMELILGVDNLCCDFKDQLGVKQDQWIAARDKAESDVRTYKQSMKVKLIELKSAGTAQAFNSNSSSFQEEQIRQMKEQTEIAKKAQEAAERERQEKLNQTRREDDSKKATATARVKAKLDAVIADATDLNEQLTFVDPDDWEAEEDLEVGRAIMKIKTWRKELEKITSIYRETRDIIAGNNVDEEDTSITEAEYLLESVGENYKNAYDALMREDNSNSLDAAKT